MPDRLGRLRVSAMRAMSFFNVGSVGGSGGDLLHDGGVAVVMVMLVHRHHFTTAPAAAISRQVRLSCYLVYYPTTSLQVFRILTDRNQKYFGHEQADLINREVNPGNTYWLKGR